MKKILVLLLCAILLTGCHMQPSSDEPGSLSTDPSTSEPIGWTPPTTVPTPSFSVQTDFSQYVPSASEDYLFTRLSPDFIHDLKASDSPTQIYPFLGRTDLDPYRDGIEVLYGITDEKGCILADPVYYRVSPVRDRNGVALPYWCLEKAIKNSDDPYDMTYRTTLAHMNGTFVSDCIYSDIKGYGDRIIAFRDTTDDVCFDVFDLEGNLVLTSTQLSFGKELDGYFREYTYGEGLYTVVLRNKETFATDSELSDKRYSTATYYMNEAGELSMGPFFEAGPFRNGLAIVEKTNGSFVYINKEQTILSAEYMAADPFQEGTAVVQLEENLWALIDSEFQTVFLSDSPIQRLIDGNFHATGYENGNATPYRSYCYSPTGEILASYNEGVFLTAKHVIYCIQGVAFILENLETNETADVHSWDTCDTIGNADHFIIASNYHGEPRCTEFLSEDLVTLGVYERFFDHIPLCEIGETITAPYVTSDETSMTIYTGYDKPIATYPEPNSTYPDPRETRLNLYPEAVAAFTDHKETRLYNAQGELFFSYPLLTDMDD